MIYQFLLARFGETGWMVAAISILGVIAGLALWLTGARFSRSIVTLIAVSIGALVGLRLPTWFSVPVGAWATAIGGALLLGISGYTLHRMWVGAGLAFLLVVWAGVAVWNVYCAGHTASLPESANIGSGQYWVNYWHSLPMDFRKISPYFCGMALLTALIIAIVWSRTAAVMLYSVLGVSVLMIMGMLAIAISKPSLLGILPSQTGAQIATFGGMVLFGAIVQWRFGPRSKTTETDTSNEPYLKDKQDPINQITAKPEGVRPMY